jgi:hypothetical protein
MPTFQRFEKNTQLMEKSKVLIDLYKRRASDRKYPERVSRAVKALENASEAGTWAAYQLEECRLDSEHLSQLELFLGASKNSNLGIKIDELITSLRDFSADLAILAEQMAAITAYSTNTKKYVAETWSFMRLYEVETGQPVRFPKGIEKRTGQTYQDSTEFIRRCLNKIDSGIDTRKAITCIRNALTHDKAVKKVLAEIFPSAKTAG